MATTFIDYTGDGNATKSFSFPSIQESDVKVEVDTVLKSSGTHYNITNYTTTGGGNVVFTSGNIPSSPSAIRIFRDTDVDSAKATYTAGSSVKAADLNANHEQLLFAAQEEQNQTVLTSNIKDAAVTTAKIAADAIDGTKLADNAVNSEHYTDGSIDTVHIADAQITTAKIADDAVTADKLANSINAEIAANTAKTTNQTHTGDVTGSVGLTIASGAVTTAKIADANVTLAKMAANSVDSDQYVDGSIDTAHIADSQVTTAKIADANITAVKIASNAVTTDKIADGELTTLAGMQSGTASKLADSTALTADIADLNQIDGMAKQTTITDDDTKFPTSGAVVDYVAAQLEPFGGFEAIANESSFPNTQPASGVVISIADAGGMAVSSSGTASGATVGGTTVNITGIASNFNGSTITTGVRFLVVSTGSGQNYTYHKATLREDDLASLSGDINDFSERYRVGSTNPTTSLDNGDLFFNTGSGKLLVYNGTNAAWEETQTVGNFFINTLSSSSATGGGSATPNGTAYRFTLSNAGASAQQHLVSVDGVVQKPNSGSSQPSEGFAISSNDIIFGSAPVSGASIFVITIGASVSIGVPSNNTVTTAILQNGSVTTAKIVDANVTTAKITDANVTTAKIADSAVTSAKIADGTIVNADINASAAIAGTKIAPSFGSQTVVAQKVQISDAGSPTLEFLDTNAGPDYKLLNADGVFGLYDETNGVYRAQVQTDGHIDLKSNVDCEAGLDVTGNITVTGTVDGRDLGTDGTKLDGIEAGATADQTNSQIASALSDQRPSMKGADFTDDGTGNPVVEIKADDANPWALIIGNTAYSTNQRGMKMLQEDGGHTKIRISGQGEYRLLNFEQDDGSSSRALMTLSEDGSVYLRHQGTIKANTTSSGLTVTGTCTATAFSGDGSALTGIQGIPSGVIMLWSGASNAIPTGFVLCDGNNSTPDLRNRFVVGATDTYSVGATGGATTDTVNISISGQTGTTNINGSNSYLFDSTHPLRKNHDHSFSGSGSDTVNTLPPYYALCYIMKT